MSKKNEEIDFTELIEKFYYLLRFKLHFDDIQASTMIMSIILLPVSFYLGFTGNSEIFVRMFFITVGLDVLVIIYSFVKFKYFKDMYKPLKPGDRTVTVQLSDIEKIDQLSGADFERFVEQYYFKKGYKTEITQKSHDFGADVTAQKGSELIVIEAKRWKNKIGKAPILFVDYAKKEYKANKAVIFTNSELTAQAKVVALRLGVKMIDRHEIKKILRNNPNIEIEMQRNV